MSFESPCVQTGSCPSPLFQKELGKMDVAEQCDMMVECTRILIRIANAGDLQILHQKPVEHLADDNVITIGPNPCPMMTPYSWEGVDG